MAKTKKEQIKERIYERLKKQYNPDFIIYRDDINRWWNTQTKSFAKDPEVVKAELDELGLDGVIEKYSKNAEKLGKKQNYKQYQPKKKGKTVKELFNAEDLTEYFNNQLEDKKEESKEVSNTGRNEKGHFLKGHKAARKPKKATKKFEKSELEQLYGFIIRVLGKELMNKDISELSAKDIITFLKDYGEYYISKKSRVESDIKQEVRTINIVGMQELEELEDFDDAEVVDEDKDE